MLNPIHIAFFYLLTLPIQYDKYDQNPNYFIFATFVLFGYSAYYFTKEAKKKNKTFLEALKYDLPTFSKPDLLWWHYIIFFIVSIPFIAFIYAIIIMIFNT